MCERREKWHGIKCYKPELHIPLNITGKQTAILLSLPTDLSALTQTLICTALISMMEKRPSTFTYPETPPHLLCPCPLISH